MSSCNNESTYPIINTHPSGSFLILGNRSLLASCISAADSSFAHLSRLSQQYMQVFVQKSSSMRLASKCPFPRSILHAWAIASALSTSLILPSDSGPSITRYQALTPSKAFEAGLFSTQVALSSECGTPHGLRRRSLG